MEMTHDECSILLDYLSQMTEKVDGLETGLSEIQVKLQALEAKVLAFEMERHGEGTACGVSSHDSAGQSLAALCTALCSLFINCQYLQPRISTCML